MPNTLQIKRNFTNNNAPNTLKGGELAYTSGDNTLYVGDVADNDAVRVLSDGDAVVAEDGTNSAYIEIKESTNDGSNKITLKVPATLASDIELAFPVVIEQNKIISGNANGQLTFENPTLSALTSITNVEGGTPNSSDVLKYNSSTSQWEHITIDAFKTLLGLGGTGTTSFADMVINGNLIVKGVTELDSSDVLIKDKTLAIGIAGGVLQASAAVSSNVATVTTSDTSTFSSTNKLWIDGNGSGIPSGIYEVTVTNATTFTFNVTMGNDTGLTLYHSTEAISDTTIDDSGLQIIGETVKKFQWNKENGGVNPYFELTEGNLTVDGDSLYIEDQEIINTTTGVLNPIIEVPASTLDVTLDGGTY